MGRGGVWTSYACRLHADWAERLPTRPLVERQTWLSYTSQSPLPPNLQTFFFGKLSLLPLNSRKMPSEI